jgi:hypothetical protein
VVGQRGIAFGAVVAGVLSGNRVDHNHVAAHGDIHLAVHLKADIALALAEGHVVAGHVTGPEARVSARGNDCHSGEKYHPISHVSRIHWPRDPYCAFRPC